MERRELAAAIRKASQLEGEFRLRSGAVAHRYFDKYQFSGRRLIEHDHYRLGRFCVKKPPSRP
jgi:hypothetical protein